MHGWLSIQTRRKWISRRMVLFVHKLCWNVYIWHVLVDPISCYHKFDLLHSSNMCEYKQCCYVGNTAQQCRLGLSEFAGDFEDSKSTSGGILCVSLGSHTFLPTSWMCKKQTSVSHSSTEAIQHQTKPTKPKMKDSHRENFTADTQSNMRKLNTNHDLTHLDHVPSSGTHISLRTMKSWLQDDNQRRPKSHNET